MSPASSDSPCVTGVTVNVAPLLVALGLTPLLTVTVTVKPLQETVIRLLSVTVAPPLL